MKSSFVAALATWAWLASSVPAYSQNNIRSQSATIVSETVRVGIQQVRYLKAGSGPTTIVLLHGWPESSYQWRHVIPILADHYTVIAPDLRGIGGTSAPSNNFEKATLARDVHGLVTRLKLQRVVMVGHDIGGMVAYAYARLYPRETVGVVILDVPLPGTRLWKTVSGSPNAWHFGFHQQKPLAERLVSGRQAVYFRYIIDSNSKQRASITDNDIAAYADAYGSPASLNAGFEWYRAFAADEKFNASRRQRIDVPMLVAGGDASMGATLPQAEEGLRSLGVRDISRKVIPNSGHYLTEENPTATADAIATFAAGLR